MESSRRDLLNYMAEQRTILIHNRNTPHPRFIFTPKISKTGCNSLKQVFRSRSKSNLT